ncbi:MAG: arsenic transporter [Planctomycetes bacterium]|nr:arsenic transporter [Planctomycetota bacterium]
MWLGVSIFTVMYLLIAGRRLAWLPFDRPAGALAGAVAMVAFGVLAPREAIDAIHGETLLLLFGLMGIGGFLAADGFLERAADSLAARCGNASRLLGALVWGAGILSALLTNDAVCVLGAPLVVVWVKRLRLPALPFLLALATAANTGSVATLVGNPQNMLCGQLGGLEYSRYLLHLAPVAVVGLALNHALLARMFRRELAMELPRTLPRAVLDVQSSITLAVLALTVVAYLCGADLAWTAAGGFTALMFVHRADTSRLWERIDWSVLLFFAGLFIAVEGLARSGATAWFFERYPLLAADGAQGAAWRASGIFLVGSNLVSNVPFILVVQDELARFENRELAWELLAMASTFAGNLTLLGSVANVIVAERGRELGGMGFFAYLKVGFPLALLTTALGTAWLILVHA